MTPHKPNKAAVDRAVSAAKRLGFKSVCVSWDREAGEYKLLDTENRKYVKWWEA